MPRDPDILLTEWREILERIKPDVLRLHHHRALWTATNDAIREHAPPQASAIWAIHYFQVYAQAQASSIRRVVLSQSGSLALDDLLTRLAQRPDVITPERLRPESELLSGHLLQVVRDDVAKWCGSDGCLDPARPLAHRGELLAETALVTEMVNKTIAHIDPQHFHKEVPLKALHEAIDHIANVFRWYGMLLNGTFYELTPVVQGDWTELLSRPLFPR